MQKVIDYEMKELTGPTIMRKDMAELLEMKIEDEHIAHIRKDPKTKEPYYEKFSGRNLVSNCSILTEIPVRAAYNTPEFYGGIRMTDIRGQGDVVCHAEQMQDVYDEIRLHKIRRVVDLVEHCSNCLECVDIPSMSDWELDKFLDAYDQPLPIGGFSVMPLQIPKIDFDPERRPQPYEYDRTSVWNKDKEEYLETISRKAEDYLKFEGIE